MINRPSEKVLLAETHDYSSFVNYNQNATCRGNNVQGISPWGSSFYPIINQMVTCGPHTPRCYYVQWYTTPEARANYLFSDGNSHAVSPYDTLRDSNFIWITTR